MADAYQLTLVNQTTDLFNDQFVVFQAPLLGAPPGVIAQYVSSEDPNTLVQIFDNNNNDAYNLVVQQTTSGQVTDFFHDTADRLGAKTIHQVDVMTSSFAESYELSLNRAGRVQSLTGSFTPDGGSTVNFAASASGHGQLHLTITDGQGHVIAEEQLPKQGVSPHGSSFVTASELADFSQHLAHELSSTLF